VRLLTANDRLAEPYGVKAAIFGPSGVGKTSLMKTLDEVNLSRWVFLDIEGGGLAIAGLKIASLQLSTWQDCQNVAAVAGGPNPALSPSAPYSEAHHKSVASDPVLSAVARYDGLFVDSITAAGRLCFTHHEQLPEAYTDRGRKDLRAVYGAHGRAMLAWLNQLQRARSKTVIFVGILERVVEDNGLVSWQPQLEGLKTGREMPGIIDLLATYQWIDFGDGVPVRTIVCTSPNRWNFPAKDRSGKLEQLEPPHLQKLLDKLLTPARAPANAEGGK
jgi:hypothetical protein